MKRPAAAQAGVIKRPAGSRHNNIDFDTGLKQFASAKEQAGAKAKGKRDSYMWWFTVAVCLEPAVLEEVRCMGA